MTLAKVLYIIVANMPQIVRLIEAIVQASENRKVADELKAIEEAFRARDADALNRIFAGRMQDNISADRLQS